VAQRTPAWQRLLSEGFFQTRQEAQRWILSGKVRSGDAVITSAGQMIRNDKPLAVKGQSQKYLSKGGLKLEGALNAFSISVDGRVCIDAGASTGGFTDCLLQHNARLVYAVDVGFGQLAGSLRSHPRVVNKERTNIGDSSLLQLDPVPTFGAVDLSYLSLRKAVPQIAGIIHELGDLVCLVKPLFEIDDPVARRTGVIADGAYLPLLDSLISSLTSDGYPVLGLTHSPVTGNQGTLEFFLWISLGQQSINKRPARFPSHEVIQSVVDAAKALPRYHK